MGSQPILTNLSRLEGAGLLVLAMLLVTTRAITQTALPNLLEVFPDPGGSALSFTSRFTLGSDPGENLIQLPATHLFTIGDAKLGGGGAAILGYRGAHQDEDASTVETMHIVLRREATSGGPDLTAAGRIQRIGPITMPRGEKRPEAWLITVTLQQPAPIPSDQTFYLGVEHNAAPQWPSDGLSTHIAHYSLMTAGDNPRQGAPNLGYTFVPVRQPAVEQPSPRTVRFGLLVGAPVLNAGAIDQANTRQLPLGSANYGAGGIWPDIAGKVANRADDPTVRIRDAANPGGFAGVFGAALLQWPGLRLPTIHGTFALGQPMVLSTYVLLDTAGSAELTIPLPAPIRPLLVGHKIYWQALSVDLRDTRRAFSNVAVHDF